jgi:stage V sporulation protein R
MLKRLIKIEEAVNRIAENDFGLTTSQVEYDVVNDQKMIELMSYNIPTNFSHWTFGREYNKLKMYYNRGIRSLALETVVDSRPFRAYLSSSNTMGVHALVMSHVIGHVHHFITSKYLNPRRTDIVDYLARATERFMEYEKRYGIDEVEKSIDAALSIQWHSSPYNNKTDAEKRQDIFNEHKKVFIKNENIFSDIMDHNNQKKFFEHEDVIWDRLEKKVPVSPEADILRFFIEYGKLTNWQNDILEVVRESSRYFWKNIRCKTVAEGAATIIHNKIMKKMKEEGTLSDTEYSEYIYSNSLVKHSNPEMLNPYYIGCSIFDDIEYRWDRSMYGEEYDNCKDRKLKENWNIYNEGAGWQKVLNVIKEHCDWSFIKEYLTPDLIEKMKILFYSINTDGSTEEINLSTNEIKEHVDNYYVSSFVPDIEVINVSDASLHLMHNYSGIELDVEYAKKTLQHLSYLWKNDVYLSTTINDKKVVLSSLL